MNKIEEFKKIVKQMADTYAAKNENYGDSFGQLYKELGPTAGIVPLYNKIHRATSLIKGTENKFESLEDTFIDLACYAIMNVIAMREKQEKEEKVKPKLNDMTVNPCATCGNLTDKVYACEKCLFHTARGDK